MYITDYLARNASKFSDKPAVIFEDKSTSWNQLWQLVKQAGDNVLQRLNGADEQKIIAILMPNSLDFLIAYLGVIQAGHIAMPLDPNFKPLESQKVVDQMKPEFIVSTDKYAGHFRDSDKILMIGDLLADITGAISKPLRLSPDEQAASMLFTSGTTGNPKSVPYTHTNHMWNSQAVSELWQWTADDTILLSLPLSHWHGLAMCVDGALLHGNTLYLQQWFDAKDTVDALQSGKISLFMHVPIAYAKLIEYAGNKQIDISKVRLCVSGSSFLPPRLWHEFKEHYGQEILERYGANEMGLLTSNTLDKRLAGCVGKPLRDVTIKILPSGEIAMRSPGLFPGYWKNPEANAKQRTKDGMWLSGDIAEIDDSGRITLKGRVQEKMKKFGYTVYPRDVEWALAKHPKVDEVIVMSLQSDSELSDEFIYFVIGEASDEEIFAFAKAEMPNYWRPDRVIHLEEIPRTGRSSKPAVNVLRQMAEKDA